MPPRPPPATATDEARAQDEEILRRLPPDDPGCLFRASLVCKAWRSLLTSSAFARSYREFHRTPPLLGFFENHDTFKIWFEPSSPTSPFFPMHPDHRDLVVLDCCHGLVLMRTPVSDGGEPAESLIVWDPVGRRQSEFPPPEFAANILYDNAVVLCAADGCDHLGCHGDHGFLVAYVGTQYDFANASVFSSETRAWSHVASYHPPEPILEIDGNKPKVLVGSILYFNCGLRGSIILRFDYISLELSMIHGPGFGMPEPPTSVLMKTEEGVLGCATMQESGLRLWSMDTVPDGPVAWTQGRLIELGSLLSPNFSIVFGFADGIGVLYLRTHSGIFTVDLKSGGVKNINPIRGSRAIPYMSFYTPGGQVGNVEGDGWVEVGNGENEGGQQEEEAAQELFSQGSKAFEDGDFVGAVDCLRRSLKIRVVHHGKLSPKCSDTYYRYGWALLSKAPQAWSASNKDAVETGRYYFDLDLAWKMLHVARVILENKSPGSTRERVKIFAALAKVSMQREDTDYSFVACFKALTILAYLVEPYYRHIMNLNIQICLTSEFPKSGDAEAISLWKSRIQNLKRANEALLADKGDDASATEVGLEESSPAKDIQLVTNILLSALEKKLKNLEQAIWTPVSEASGEQHVDNDVPRALSLTSSSSQFSGSSNTMSAAARIAEGSPSSESDSSRSTDGQSRSTAQDDSVSE